MRSTVVPAQVTTVEDKITGRLGLSQLLLLTVPVFGGSMVFVVFPPFFEYAMYKIVLITAFAAFSALLANRFKGRILLTWAVAILRYNLRPKYYVFNKNNAHMRPISSKPKLEEQPEEETKLQKTVTPSLPQLSTAELVHIEGLIANPQANLHFKTNRKGELYVHITEVKA